MATQKDTTPKKSSMNPIIAVGIGCFVLLFILGTAATLAIRFFARQLGTSLVQTAIQSKTGVKTDLSNIQNGKMTFTDPKTGETVDIGTGKIPDSFPKDFPLYPGATVESAMAGTGNTTGKGNGVWVTFTTKDNIDAVTAYYKKNLASSGWTVSGTFAVAGVTTFTVQKGATDGTVVMSTDSSKNQTAIVVTLGDKSGSSDQSNTAEPTPDTSTTQY